MQKSRRESSNSVNSVEFNAKQQSGLSVVFDDLIGPLKQSFDEVLLNSWLSWLSFVSHRKSGFVLIITLLTWSLLNSFAITSVSTLLSAFHPLLCFLNVFYPLLCISCCYYWLAISTRHSLTDTNLYTIMLINLFNDFICNSIMTYSSYQISFILQFNLLFMCSFLMSLSLFLLSFLNFKLSFIIISLSSIGNALSIRLSQFYLSQFYLCPYLNLIFELIGIILARTTERSLCPPCSSLDGRVVAWRRRRSSNASFSVPRRTSLPILGGSRSHGNNVSLYCLLLELLQLILITLDILVSDVLFNFTRI